MRAPLISAAGRLRLARTVAVVAVLGCFAIIATIAPGSVAGTTASAATAANAAGGFSQTKTITRTIAGQATPVDSRTVTLSVSATTNLTDRQNIDVTWTGAHPTGADWRDVHNTVVAAYQEYPMVLLQCHGVSGSTAPLDQQIKPEDCWTTPFSSRFFDQPDSAGGDYPPWRLDQYAASADRQLVVNQPKPLPASCAASLPLGNPPTYWLHYAGADGTDFPVGPPGGLNQTCALFPNEMGTTGAGGILPNNEMFVPTNTDGTGSAQFTIFGGASNLDLGCSPQNACALVAIPIMGISCDPAGGGLQPAAPAAKACESGGNFAAGATGTDQIPNQTAPSVQGAYWWAASNWRNRFVVPLAFAPSTGVCSSTTQSKGIQLYGSEVMAQAVQQWQPFFCQDSKLFPVAYVPESEAASLLQLQTGQIEAALVSNQPSGGFNGPVVRAPIGATGFAIGFTIDGPSGAPVTSLKLDARLLAKLLTQSYPGVADIARFDAQDGIQGNPVNISQDPEFQALNPGVGTTSQVQSAALLSLSENTDVIYALTSYIASDPAALAWLNGQPDPWGMKVNLQYAQAIKSKNLVLPVAHWPLLSTFEPQDWLTPGRGGPGACYVLSPTPALQLIANPVINMYLMAQYMQFAISQTQVGQCAGGDPVSGAGSKLPVAGPQVPGHRFIIGLMTLGDATRYGVGVASLLTHTSAGTPAKFTSASGMTFVSPDTASLSAAAALLAPDAKNNLWSFPYSLYQHNDPKAAAAYPGFMLVYADVPTALPPPAGSATAGALPAADAANLAQFVKYAAGTGQTPGAAVGNLSGGYLPMTAANHLAAQASYAATAAVAIAEQKGAVPPIVPSPTPSPTPSGSQSASRTPSPTATATSTPTSRASAPGTAAPSPTGSATISGPAAAPSATPSATTGSVSLTPEANFGVLGYVLPILAGLALLASAGSVVVTRISRSRGQKWA